MKTILSLFVIAGAVLLQAGYWDKPDRGTRVQNGQWTKDVTAPKISGGISFQFKQPYDPALRLTFEYRITSPGSVKYLGIIFSDAQKQTTYNEFPASAEWKKAELPFGRIRYATKFSGARLAGAVFERINIYAKLAAPAPVRLELRKLKIDKDPDFNAERAKYQAAAAIRVSYSAYPLFDWKPVPGATGYELSYRGETHKTRECFFVPEKPVAPGMLEYTVRALPSGKTARTDKMIVPKRTVRWRLPEFDFAAYAKLPHPRLKKLAQYWQPDAAELIPIAERFMKTPIPPNPQPYREGADPKIRAWIIWYGKIAGGVIAVTGDRMLAVAQAAILTGRRDFRESAKEKALKIAREWDTKGGASMRYTDLHSARLLRGVGWCYDAAYDIMTPEERKAVQDCIRERADEFWQNIFPFHAVEAHNHSWDRAEAAAFGALMLAEFPEMEMHYRYVAALYAYRFIPSLGFDGENNEGLKYWSYGLGLAVRFQDTAKYTLGIDYFTQPWMRQTARFPLYGMPSGGYMASFGDNGKPNHCGFGPLDRKFTGKLAAASHDPQALWYAGYPEKNGVTARMPLDIPQSRYFPQIGIVNFNTFLPDGRENVAVAFHSGKFFAGHQHADQNSFQINAYGDKLAIDGGYYDWWGSKHFYAYSIQTAAHNTVLVDGRGQDWRKTGADGETTAFFDSPNFGFVAGDAAKVYQNRLAQFDRDLLFVKPDFVFVFDRLAAPKESVFSWLLHSHTDDPIQLNGRDFSIRRPLAELYGTMLLPADAKGKVAPAYTVMPVNGYSVNPVPDRQKEWCLTLEPAAKAKRAEFLAAMRIARPGEVKAPPQWKVTDAGSAVLITGNGVEVLFNRTPGKTVRLGRFETDARCAAVILENGRIVDVMKAGGEKFLYAGRTYGKHGSFALTDKPQIRTEPCGLLRVNGKTVPAKLHTVTYPFGRKVYSLEALFPFDRTCSAGITAGAAGHFIIGSGSGVMQGVLAAGKTRLVPLQAGKKLLSITSAQPLKQVEITSVPGDFVPAKLMPVQWQPAQGAVIVEAENIARENGPRGMIQVRPYASAGKANTVWGVPGKYGEWEFTVPQTGKYRFYVRYAVPLSGSLRELQIDDRMLNPDVAGLQLPSTGGFGYAAGEWRYAAMPEPVTLTAGKHVLRLTVLGGEGNLDCFALEPTR